MRKKEWYKEHIMTRIKDKRIGWKPREDSKSFRVQLRNEVKQNPNSTFNTIFNEDNSISISAELKSKR